MTCALKYFIWISLVISFAGISCKKETSCQGCKENNKPPIALAGPDQVITLPTDSVLLDGSSSNDPDGTISEWLWTKISGPASFNISNVSSSKTKVKNLTAGIYLFELKVTDNRGTTDTDTLQVSVNDPWLPGNRPPVAVAGADQIIILPTSTAIVDASGSNDPDNNITSYQWRKISGPFLIHFLNVNAVQTQITNLEQGVYKIEVKVTDAGGLFSTDTMQINVIAQPTDVCNDNSRPIINAQLIPIGQLSKPRVELAVASAGTKIVFAGGSGTPDCPECWGSKRVDIYDTVTHLWSTVELSQGRFGLSAVASGNKIFFAGGESGDGAFDILYSNVDIYDVVSNTWSVNFLSEPRSYIATAAVGNKVLFAGGWQADINWGLARNKVDIYDIAVNGWSTATLSQPRGWISAVTSGQKVYFAGGLKNGSPFKSNLIDIYDDANSSWSASSLQVHTGVVSSIAVNGNIYWSGGCPVEIRNTGTGSSSIANLAKPGGYFSGTKDGKIVFLNGGDRFDIYDTNNNTWSVGVLPHGFGYFSSSIISVNNTIYVSNGDQVWKLEF